MPYHNILSKLDRAIVAYLISEGAGTADDVYPAKRDLDKVLPNTVVISDDWDEEPVRSRCFIIPVRIHVRTPASVDANEDASTILAASELRVQQTFDPFFPVEDQDGSVLGQLITDAAVSAGVEDFTCDSAIAKKGDRGQREKDWAWIDTLELECFCRATTE